MGTAYIPGREPGSRPRSDLAGSWKTQQQPELEAQSRPIAYDLSSDLQHGIQGPPNVDPKKSRAGAGAEAASELALAWAGYLEVSSE